MLGWLFDLLRGRRVRVEGTARLPEGHARKIDLGDPLAGGRQVLLCRVEGQLHALDARCPHEGGRLAEGPLAEGRFAVCPLHGFQFDPATGRPVRGVCAPARVCRVRESDGGCDLWA